MEYTLKDLHFLLWDYVVRVYEEAHANREEVSSVAKIKEQWFSSQEWLCCKDSFGGEVHNNCFLCYAYLSETCEGCPLYEKATNKADFCSYYYRLYFLSLRSPCPYDEVIEMSKQIRDCWR